MIERTSFGKLLMASVITMVLMLSLMTMPYVAAANGETYCVWGPKLDYVLIKIYGSYEAEVIAFETGDIDMLDWPLDFDTYDAIKSDSDYVVEPLTMYDYYDIDINNLRWPTSDVNFRRALAYLVDYETFYTTVLRAYSGVLMDSIIWSEWTDYYNPSSTKYYFDETTALAILNSAGYDDWDSDGTIEYKNITGTYELPPLIFYSRTDDSLRLSLGDMINDELTSIGIPVDYIPAEQPVCSVAAYETYEYHLYTAGAGPFTNPLFLYDYYHSDFGVGWPPTEPWAPNNVFFTNSTYDDWATILKQAPDKETAIEACMECQEIFMDQVGIIPVYHSAGSTAYRAKYGHWTGEETYWDMNWTDVVNSRFPTTTSGVNDEWTLLNAHPASVTKGGVLRYGLMNDATAVNPVWEYWYWDAIIVNMIYDTLMRFDPYTGALLPSLAGTWSTGVWDNGGEDALVATFNLRKDVTWNDGEPFNSTDVAFTMQYMFDAGSPLFYMSVETIKDIDTTPMIETPDPYTVKIYFSTQSMWNLQLVGLVPIIPEHVWGSIDPAQSATDGEYETTGYLTGTGPYMIVSHEEGESWLLEPNPDCFLSRIPGDVNNDDYVNAKDAVLLGVAFYPFGTYNPDADINADNYVNAKDAVLLGAHFNEHW